MRIEDYALLSDMESAALVGRDGSIDWLTFPRFDSPACFAALLGDAENGRWLLAPAGQITHVERRYRGDSFVLETVFTTPDGEVAVVDCMPPRNGQLDIVRLVEGRGGAVPMRMELVVRFDYGSAKPWVRRAGTGLTAVAGPDALRLATPVDLRGEDMRTVATFTVRDGDRVPFELTWHPSHEECKPQLDVEQAIADAEDWWATWIRSCTYTGEFEHEVRRSLAVLKALTYAPTGGIVAAASTSLPEWIGGQRNWDYRFCWLRDTTFSLLALLQAGFTEEADAWREWLLRAVGGEPSQLQIMYGPAGERRLGELEASWLAGYEGSTPVRIGNGACDQFQLDVYGEVVDALHHSALDGHAYDESTWSLQQQLVEHLEGCWRDPDDGIWEVRGSRQHFTHSKVMAWVALDRSIRAAEQWGLPAPLARWRGVRDAIKRQVLEHGVDDRGVLVQHYGTTELDASLLMVPLVGFLPPDDERVRNTVDAIQRELVTDGFVSRYRTRSDLDGLPPGEGSFLLCSFWLADNLALLGRTGEARELFERLLSLSNDVGLLSEQYDPRGRRLLGNFPQAFSHVALVNTAMLLTGRDGTRRGAPA